MSWYCLPPTSPACTQHKPALLYSEVTQPVMRHSLEPSSYSHCTDKKMVVCGCM